MEMGSRDNCMTTATALLRALADGQEKQAWVLAQTLAKTVLDDPKTVLSRAVLDGGPFAMRKAEELAEEILAEAGGGVTVDAGGGATP